jgi:hypothetical protein
LTSQKYAGTARCRCIISRKTEERCASDAMRCWIDAQGYCNSETKFIPKEVAVVTEEVVSKYIVIYSNQLRTFKPCDRKLVIWATKNHHRIPYYVGDTHEIALKGKIITNITACSEIYTKGSEKVRWLERLLQKPVVDLQVLGCPSLSKLQLGPACPEHLTVDSRCAVSTALYMRSWFNGGAGRPDGSSIPEQADGR